MSMTPEELSRLRELCKGSTTHWPLEWTSLPVTMLKLLDEVERLQNFHEELNSLRINIENIAGQSSDEWKASGLEAVATMLRMWFLEEGQERKQIIRRQATSLNEANKLLDQTIEVLEAYERMRFSQGYWWHEEQAKPLLDNLKALKKEVE